MAIASTSVLQDLGDLSSSNDDALAAMPPADRVGILELLLQVHEGVGAKLRERLDAARRELAQSRRLS